MQRIHKMNKKLKDFCSVKKISCITEAKIQFETVGFKYIEDLGFSIKVEHELDNSSILSMESSFYED